jgi:GNAT superfamily N-acetyltransferase
MFETLIRRPAKPTISPILSYAAGGPGSASLTPAARRVSSNGVESSFGPVAAGEVTDAYALYLGAVAWLREKGIRQWLTPVSLETFVAHQTRAELHGYWMTGALTAIAALVCRSDCDWQQIIGQAPVWWIDTLAVARRREGQNIGSRMLQQCEATIAAKRAAAVYLDCHAGFLPTYYAAAGYVELAQRRITYPTGNTYPMVLMRKALSRESRSAFTRG